MTFERAMAFLLFAVVAAVTPGPSNVMLTAAGARGGVAGGLPCLLGATTGMGSMMFLVPLGLGSVVLGHPLPLAVLRWGGAAFLLWLAWQIATSAGDDPGAEARPVGFVEAAVFQWVNPKAWLVSVGAAATYLSPESGSAFAQSAFLGGLFALAALPSGFVWLAFGAAVQQLLRGPRARRAFNVSLGVVLALSVVLIVR
jgi:threonine/homoserine/homoserine lactone efflux protein